VIPLAFLPALNATLNATSALLLTTGYLAIRRRRVHLHRACMVAAFVTSVAFLVSYVTYHVQVGTTHFPGEGWVRPMYFALLGTHTILAAAVAPLATVTLALAARARFDRHARLARLTLPVWLYVSLTGVVIYVLLYHVYPPAERRRAVAAAAAQLARPNPTATASDRPSGGSPGAPGSSVARSAASP
jgi:putative membrane protein